MNTVYTVESSLAFDTSFHPQYSPDVESLEAQPQGFYCDFEGKSCRYTPDFRMKDSKQGERFIKGKLITKTLQSDFRLRFKIKQERANELGIQLLLVTCPPFRLVQIFIHILSMELCPTKSYPKVCKMSLSDVSSLTGTVL